MLKAIYLSGWEYNRVLQDTPFARMASGLPAQVLWNGAAQFWLFETVYCTKESLDGDRAAFQDVGWTTGQIFEDLEKRGFLTPVDWMSEAENKPSLKSDLEAAHRALREQIHLKDIQDLLKAGREAELEAIKLRLLSPFLLRLKCVKNVSPNSIRHWIHPSNDQLEARGAVAAAGALLGAALSGSRSKLRAGFRLCEVPGTGLSSRVMALQKQAEETIQRPLIPDLLSGVLAQEEYHRQVAVTREVYEPVNTQLWADYVKNRDTLERLRDVARLHLWPQLHNEWLPELDNDPGFLIEFQSLLHDALRRREFDPYLQFTTDVGIITIGGLVGAIMGPDVGIESPFAGVIGATAAEAVRRALDLMHGSIRDKSDNLVLFLQKGRKILQQVERQ